MNEHVRHSRARRGVGGPLAGTHIVNEDKIRSVKVGVYLGVGGQEPAHHHGASVLGGAAQGQGARKAGLQRKAPATALNKEDPAAAVLIQVVVGGRGAIEAFGAKAVGKRLGEDDLLQRRGGTHGSSKAWRRVLKKGVGIQRRNEGQ